MHLPQTISWSGRWGTVNIVGHVHEFHEYDVVIHLATFLFNFPKWVFWLKLNCIIPGKKLFKILQQSLFLLVLVDHSTGNSVIKVENALFIDLELKNCCLNYVDTVSGYWETHKTMEIQNNNYCLEWMEWKSPLGKWNIILNCNHQW